MKIKKVKKSSGAGGNGESKKNENSENGSNNNNNPAGPVNIETELKKVSPKSAKEFWFASMNLCDKQKILTEKVMTPRNYLWFRQNPLSGYLTLMAGRSPHYKDYKEEITKQYTDLGALFGKSFEKIDEIKSSYKQRIARCVASKDFKRLNALKEERNALIEKCKNKITILEDPFIEDDPVIIVLIDKLSPDGDWKHLTRKKIESKSLKEFVLGGFSWETVKDEFGNDQQIKVQHYAEASYFAVMSRWQERPLMIDGKERKMVVGNIHALGRQIDYFLEDDLKTYSEKLRRTN